MSANTPLTQRKQDHIDAVLKDPKVERGGHGFDTIKLSHRALPELDCNEVECSTKFIASGGIRNGIDMVKAVIMGGQLCGVAAPLLKPAQQGAAEVIEKIEQFKQEFKTAQFLLGIDKADQLHLNESLINKK